MYLRARLIIAALIGVYGLAVMLAMTLLAVGPNPPPSSNVFLILLYVFPAASLAGFITAPLFGHYHLGGVAISLFGSVVSTGIAASIVTLVIGGPDLVVDALGRGAFGVGAFFAVINDLVFAAAMGVIAVTVVIWSKSSVLVLWFIGMIATHSLARRVRRKTDLRPFNP